MTSVEFIYKEIPHSRGSIDKCINITPNEICTMLDKYAASKAENEIGRRLSIEQRTK